MTLQYLRQQFHCTLETLYPNEEIDSFFFILTERWLQINRLKLALEPYYRVTEKQQSKFLKALKRLEAYEPIQYIVGETHFFSLPIKVNKHTLIPRPETEELVQWILDDTQKLEPSCINILDIGTGSGCIAIALAKHLPEAKIYALEVSEKALQIAQANAELNQVKVSFEQENILSPTEAHVFSNLKFDVIVSNPPYVRQLEKQQMKPNVLDYEPHLALFVENTDALLFYRAISAFAVKNLKSQGHLYFEINQYLGEEMKALLQQDYNNMTLRKDLFGNDRMLKATKR